MRAELFGQLIVHLDFVAGMDEEDHGGSVACQYIRVALILFLEVEQDAALNLEW